MHALVVLFWVVMGWLMPSNGPRILPSSFASLQISEYCPCSSSEEIVTLKQVLRIIGEPSHVRLESHRAAEPGFILLAHLYYPERGLILSFQLYFPSKMYGEIVQPFAVMLFCSTQFLEAEDDVASLIGLQFGTGENNALIILEALRITPWYGLDAEVQLPFGRSDEIHPVMLVPD